MKKLSALLILFFAVLSCEKTEFDYRDMYTGEYDFTIEQVSRNLYTGHFDFYMAFDTSYYHGSVTKVSSSPELLSINWGIDTIKIEGGAKLDRNNTQMSVDTAGNLNCDVPGDAFWNPAYIHGDTIHFTFYWGRGMSHKLWTQWVVKGIKSS